MSTSTRVALAYLAAYASAHGVVTKITGANGVEMPGLSSQFSFDAFSSRSHANIQQLPMEPHETAPLMDAALRQTQPSFGIERSTVARLDLWAELRATVLSMLPP